MPNRFETAIAKGLAKVKAVAGVPVTIARGSASAEVEKAIRGSSPVEVTDSNGQRILITRRDFLIDADDYDFGDGPVEPKSGDEITDGTDTYEVAPLGGRNAPWRWSDRARTRYRIHTAEK